MNRHPETVTASEIADYVYCGEAWRLAALGHESANRPSRDAGTVHHARKATAERAAGVSIAAGRILVVLAILAFIVFLIHAR
jgi:hypothetical protein